MLWVFYLLLAWPGASTPGVAVLNPTVSVSFRQGTLSAAQIEAWLRFRPPSAKLATEEARRRRIEERVLLEVLDRRFQGLGLASDPQAQGWQRLLERRLAAAALHREVSAQTIAPEAEVEAAFRADPHRFDTERRFKLQNLFKRFPQDADDEGRERLRREMSALRERLVAGADFAELARQESESATRARGGSLGSTTLAQLHPEVRGVVATLAPGELSPIVETAEGLTLLRCTGVIEPTRVAPEEVRERLGLVLRKERLERVWDELTAKLLAELDLVYHLAPLGETPESAIVTVRRGEVRETLDRRDLELYLRDQRAAPPAALPAEPLHRHAEALVLQLAQAREAERRGLTTTAEHRERLELESLEMRAELALAPEIRRRLTAPSEAEIAALYERGKDRLAEPARLHLRTLEIPIRGDLPAAFYRRVHALGPRLLAGEMSLEQAREELSPHARLADLGWLGEREAWQLGRNVEVTLEKLRPGGLSAPVQEGPRLLILHLVERSEERPLGLAETREQLAAALVAAQRERLRTELRAALLAEQEIRFQP